MLDLVLTVCVVIFIRVLPLVQRSNVNIVWRAVAEMMMRSPSLWLGDSWYRGWYVSNPAIIQYLIDNGWWDDLWPTSYLNYVGTVGMFALFIMNKVSSFIINLNDRLLD